MAPFLTPFVDPQPHVFVGWKLQVNKFGKLVLWVFGGLGPFDSGWPLSNTPIHSLGRIDSSECKTNQGVTSASGSQIHPPSPGAVVVPGVGEVQMELRKEQTSWGNSEISTGSEPRFWVT